MNYSLISFKDPIIKVVETGLRLWLINQCDEVDELEIEISGSTLTLLKGRINSIKLSAKSVILNKLPMQQVILKSGPILFNMNPKNREKGLKIKQPFQLAGSISIHNTALNEILMLKPWNNIGDSLSEKLLGITPLGGIKIEHESLELYAPVIGQEKSAKQTFLVNAEQGTIRISNRSSTLVVLLPMDPNIAIEKAYLRNNSLHLMGKAIVNP